MKVIETNMNDGIDLIHEWSSVEEALKSGRFDYVYQMWCDEYDDEMEEYDIKNEDDLFNFFRKECDGVEDFIEKISYPFYLAE
jgi:hypothetical protein